MEALTLTELDTLRADTMKALLNEKGQNEIWKYDVMELKQAFREALGNYNFDAIQIDGDGLKAGHQYALVGPGIEDIPFTTPEELIAHVTWVCTKHYGEGYIK